MHVYTYLLFLWGMACVGSLAAQPTSTEDQQKQAQQARERRERVAGLKRAEEAREKRERNRVPVPYYTPPATPTDVAIPQLPPYATIRASCKKEQVGVCIKRRMRPLTPRKAKQEEKSLRPHYGDAWREISDQLHTFWELLLYAADTGNVKALAPFLSYPFQLNVEPHYTESLWLTWPVNKAEFTRVFPLLMRVSLQRYDDVPCEDAGDRKVTAVLVRMESNNRLCCEFKKMIHLKQNLLDNAWCVVHSGWLFTEDLRVYFSVKTLPVGKRDRYTYKVVFEEFQIISSDFSNDIGRIRYELKRKGRRNAT